MALKSRPWSRAGAAHRRDAGRVVELRGDAIIVACGRGRLALKELQRPGKKPVAARDLMNTLNLAGRRLG